jgi:hypothetical protein
METAPEQYHVGHLVADCDERARTYLDVLRHEQTRFLDALGEAGSLLGGSCGLARAAAIQTQLTRRFFDAQRALLRRRAEFEAAVALAATDDFDVEQPDGAEGARQLAALLDDWWRAENQNGQTRIEAARAHSDMHTHAASSSAPSRDVVRAAHLSPDMVAALDAADPADLRSLLIALEGLLEPAAAEEERLEGRPVDDGVIIWLAPEPIGLQPIGASWSR